MVDLVALLVLKAASCSWCLICTLSTSRLPNSLLQMGHHGLGPVFVWVSLWCFMLHGVKRDVLFFTSFIGAFEQFRAVHSGDMSGAI